MYLANIAVRNFRNLKHFEIALNPGLNVIVGENNVGKTNLLDAIRAGLGAASVTGELVRLDKDDLHVDSAGVRNDTPIRVDFRFAGLSEPERAQCIEILNYDAIAPEKSTASIHFDWSWNDKTGRWTLRRWAGDRPDAESAVPDEVLQGIPVTLLGAMRDALSALTPGRQSRLGKVLTATAEDADRSALEGIMLGANTELQKSNLIDRVEKRIGDILSDTSGPELTQQAAIRTSEPHFERIVNSLRLVLKLPQAKQDEEAKKEGEEQLQDEEAIRELQSNGLGYNNLLYIATVLAELTVTPEIILPLLFVEEPEAHLHPQLQTLLADYLGDASRSGSTGRTQTIITTHSPTIAAHVSPRAIKVMHWGAGGGLNCVGLDRCGLDERENSQLRRLLDVTKATLLFSKGVILVEGITEALLLPVLARRLRITLEQHAVSIMPVYGVDFATLAKLFGDTKLELPLAIVTDGDPAIIDAEEHGGKIPKGYPEPIEACARVKALKKLESTDPLIKVFNSTVTLEYDLALAGSANSTSMCSVWESLYERSPTTFNADLLEKCGDDPKARALLVWRGVCLSAATRSKAEFAQALALALDERKDGVYVVPIDAFTVPEYLAAAITHVVKLPKTDA